MFVGVTLMSAGLFIAYNLGRRYARPLYRRAVNYLSRIGSRVRNRVMQALNNHLHGDIDDPGQ